jgi:hypothetical protein
MMGERRVMQEALFYGFSLERYVPNHILRKIDRFVDLSGLRAFGASAVQGGPPQSCLSLVLSIGAGRRRSRSFDVFQEPPRPFPRERSFAQNCSRRWWCAA